MVGCTERLGLKCDVLIRPVFATIGMMKKIYLEVRPSPIEGQGAFALRRIPKKTRIIEYTGERITPDIAQERYGLDDHDLAGHEDVPKFYLFTVDSRTIIDGAHGGSDARFINHSCSPNCEAIVEEGCVYIEALRTIWPGEELAFDYQLELGGDITDQDRKHYACTCGAENCRGTMLSQPKVRRLRSGRLAATRKQPA